MFLVDDFAVEAVEALSVRARVVATQVSVLHAELADIALRLDGAVPDGMTTVEWLCLQTGLMPIEACRLLRVARKLAKLPGLAAAFEAGSLSEGTVDVLVRVATPANEHALLEAAQVATGAQLHTIVRSYQRQKPTPTPEDEPGDPDPQDRPDEFSGGFDDDGRYRFRGNVGPDLGARLDSSLRGEIDADRRRRAETHDDDTRPRPSEDPPLSLAGALSNLVDGHLSALAARRANGIVPSTHTAIVHLDKHNIEAGWTNDAAWLHNGGALTPHQTMLAACDAAWRAVLSTDLDPQGVTRQHRLAGPAQRAACYARDRTCVFPGCGRTRWLKLHHLPPHTHGGTTSLDNLAFLCQIHHTLIHKPGWTITGNPNTGLTFTRPDGTTVQPCARPDPNDLPLPPPADPNTRYTPTGETLTAWAHDMLLAHWLAQAPLSESRQAA